MSSKRDLLVLSKKVSCDPQQLKREVEVLDTILYFTETTQKLCTCVEVIDVNRYKIFSDPEKLEKLVAPFALKAFQFLLNKN